MFHIYNHSEYFHPQLVPTDGQFVDDCLCFYRETLSTYKWYALATFNQRFSFSVPQANRPQTHRFFPLQRMKSPYLLLIYQF